MFEFIEISFLTFNLANSVYIKYDRALIHNTACLLIKRILIIYTGYSLILKLTLNIPMDYVILTRVVIESKLYMSLLCKVL